jgi:hypothetical protein
MRAHPLLPLLRRINFQMVETGSIIEIVFIVSRSKILRIRSDLETEFVVNDHRSGFVVAGFPLCSRRRTGLLTELLRV